MNGMDTGIRTTPFLRHLQATICPAVRDDDVTGREDLVRMRGGGGAVIRPRTPSLLSTNPMVLRHAVLARGGTAPKPPTSSADEENHKNRVLSLVEKWRPGLRRFFADGMFGEYEPIMSDINTMELRILVCDLAESYAHHLSAVNDRIVSSGLAMIFGAHPYIQLLLHGNPFLHNRLHDLINSLPRDMGSISRDLFSSHTNSARNFLLNAARCNDPLVRYFAADCLVLEPREKRSADVLVGGLMDSECAITMNAYFALEHRFPDILERLSGDIFIEHGPSDSCVDSPAFGINHYVYAMGLDRYASHHFFFMLQNAPTHTPTTIGNRVSLNSTTPMHSLADYNPYPHMRKPIMEKRYGELVGIVKEVGQDKEKVMEKAFGSYDDEIIVLQLPSGKRYVVQGHHRMAAFYKAAKNGVIPEDWLDEIPVKLLKYTGPMPEPLIRRVLTLGVDLTWDDLLPPV